MVIIYIILGHLTENTIVMQLLHKVVGVNSQIPRVHAVAGGSLLLLGSGLVHVHVPYKWLCPLHEKTSVPEEKLGWVSPRFGIRWKLLNFPVCIHLLHTYCFTVSWMKLLIINHSLPYHMQWRCLVLFKSRPPTMVLMLGVTLHRLPSPRPTNQCWSHLRLLRPFPRWLGTRATPIPTGLPVTPQNLKRDCFLALEGRLVWSVAQWSPL